MEQREEIASCQDYRGWADIGSVEHSQWDRTFGVPAAVMGDRRSAALAQTPVPLTDSGYTALINDFIALQKQYMRVEKEFRIRKE